MQELDDDSRIAKKLDLAPEQVVLARDQWQKNRIMRAVLEDALDRQIEQRRNALETISADDLKTKQGEIAGIRAARGIVLKPEK